MDTFDKIRTTVAQIKAPISCGINWYSSFDSPDGIVPHVAEGLLGGHDVKVAGFTKKNGIDYIVVQNSWGESVGDKGLFYFDRWTSNQYLGKFGMGYWTDNNISMEQYTIIEAILKNMTAIVQLLINSLKPSMKPIDPQPIIPIDEVIPAPAPVIPKYDWSTKEAARHSVRVICDECDLSWDMKNRLDKTVEGESNFNPRAVGKINTNGSTDWGIAQWNDRLWIGAGKLFPSTDYVLANPEHCIREMCKQFKAGHANYWVAYKKLYPNG